MTGGRGQGALQRRLAPRPRGYPDTTCPPPQPRAYPAGLCTLQPHAPGLPPKLLYGCSRINAPEPLFDVAMTTILLTSGALASQKQLWGGVCGRRVECQEAQSSIALIPEVPLGRRPTEDGVWWTRISFCHSLYSLYSSFSFLSSNLLIQSAPSDAYGWSFLQSGSHYLEEQFLKRSLATCSFRNAWELIKKQTLGLLP